MRFINHKKRRHKRFLIILLIGLLISYHTIHRFNDYLQPRLLSISRSEATRAISNLSFSLLQTLKFNENDLLHVTKDKQGHVKSIDYNTKQLNIILKESIHIINQSLEAADEGKKDPYLNKVIFKEGIIYKVSLGSLTKFSLLNDIGPQIPVRLQLFHNAIGNIETKMEPYGINSTLMKIILKLRIETEIGTVLNVSKVVIHSEVPLVIQIINGDIPNYFPFNAQSTGY
ncbi:MAG: sporulation protein YunB [Erysipelotrichaceae bacterium]